MIKDMKSLSLNYVTFSSHLYFVLGCGFIFFQLEICAPFFLTSMTVLTFYLTYTFSPYCKEGELYETPFHFYIVQCLYTNMNINEDRHPMQVIILIGRS